MPIPHEPAFDPAEYAARTATVRAAMAERGLDALLVFSPHNVFYLSGMDSENLFDFQCLIVPADAPTEPVLVILDFEEARAANSVGFGRSVSYHAFDDPIGAVVAQLDALGLTEKGRRLGLESRAGITPAAYAQVIAALPGAAIEDPFGIVEGARIVKSRRGAGVHAPRRGPHRRGNPGGLRSAASRRSRRRDRRRHHGRLLSRRQRHGLLGTDRRLRLPRRFGPRELQRADDPGRRNGVPGTDGRGAEVHRAAHADGDPGPAVRGAGARRGRRRACRRDDPRHREAGRRRGGRRPCRGRGPRADPPRAWCSTTTSATRSESVTRERGSRRSASSSASTIRGPLRAGMVFHLPMSLRKFGEWGINQSHTMLITEAGTETLTKTPARLQVLDAAAV